MTNQCKFVVNYLVFRFFPEYMEFCRIFNQLTDSADFYATNSEVLMSVQQYLANLGNSRLSNFLNTLTSILSATFTQTESAEITKMLILNRFLLSP